MQNAYIVSIILILIAYREINEKIRRGSISVVIIWYSLAQ
ncbi:hypothetical protein LDG_6195 [Legionella drancourtii LLAP12]|uniref:Uncharacterized protein n=1 Tax=Legionella drancourtii LLAP12 TaxID=658187 RepID=G9ELT5_9GAMM|nr:hypothetical protein LDG_6195 [Legionella drancourtii LLAP12]